MLSINRLVEATASAEPARFTILSPLAKPHLTDAADLVWLADLVAGETIISPRLGTHWPGVADEDGQAQTDK